jgi:hypothetical protein
MLFFDFVKEQIFVDDPLLTVDDLPFVFNFHIFNLRKFSTIIMVIFANEFVGSVTVRGRYHPRKSIF